MAASPGFLSRLGEDDRAALAGRWAVRSYRPNEMIIEDGDSGRDVFFLLEGRARATSFSTNGREVAYRDIEPGDIFGELAAIDGEMRSAIVVALGPSRVARLSQTSFREIVNGQPTFAWVLLQHLSAQVRRMTDRVYELSTLVVRKRLILELLRQAGDIEPSDDEVFISPAPTHFDLAARISTHREAVSREMSTLNKKGLVQKCGRKLVLRNIMTLEMLAGKEE